MNAMSKKARKSETTEEKLDRWYAGQAKITDAVRTEVMSQWEAGQAAYITVGGCHYEKFELNGGDYVVVEWDDDGNVTF